MSSASRPSLSGSGLPAATAQVRWMDQLPDLVDREGFGITILVVDREASWKRRLGESCLNAGYHLLAASDGLEGLRMFFEHRPDLVITDVRVPGLDGFELVSRIREVSQIPIIVCSALDKEEEKVHGLRLGADDYVVKPTGMRELLARVEAALRRARVPATEVKHVYADGVLTIDFDRQEVLIKGDDVNLTPKEFKLLVYLVQRSGKVVSARGLLDGVWGSPHYTEDLVKWHIANLRRVIEAEPRNPRLIITVWGRGYRYEKPSIASLG